MTTTTTTRRPSHGAARTSSSSAVHPTHTTTGITNATRSSQPRSSTTTTTTATVAPTQQQQSATASTTKQWMPPSSSSSSSSSLRSTTDVVAAVESHTTTASAAAPPKSPGGNTTHSRSSGALPRPLPPPQSPSSSFTAALFHNPKKNYTHSSAELGSLYTYSSPISRQTKENHVPSKPLPLATTSAARSNTPIHTGNGNSNSNSPAEKGSPHRLYAAHLLSLSPSRAPPPPPPLSPPFRRMPLPTLPPPPNGGGAAPSASEPLSSVTTTTASASSPSSSLLLEDGMPLRLSLRLADDIVPQTTTTTTTAAPAAAAAAAITVPQTSSSSLELFLPHRRRQSQRLLDKCTSASATIARTLATIPTQQHTPPLLLPQPSPPPQTNRVPFAAAVEHPKELEQSQQPQFRAVGSESGPEPTRPIDDCESKLPLLPHCIIRIEPTDTAGVGCCLVKTDSDLLLDQVLQDDDIDDDDVNNDETTAMTTTEGVSHPIEDLGVEGRSVVDAGPTNSTLNAKKQRTSGLAVPRSSGSGSNPSATANASSFYRTHHNTTTKAATTTRIHTNHNPSRSLRTGKPLSSIPDSAVPPPSPLVTLSTTMEDTNISKDVDRRRSHSLNNNSSVKRQLLPLQTSHTNNTIPSASSSSRTTGATTRTLPPPAPPSRSRRSSLSVPRSRGSDRSSMGSSTTSCGSSSSNNNNNASSRGRRKSIMALSSTTTTVSRRTEAAANPRHGINPTLSPVAATTRQKPCQSLATILPQKDSSRRLTVSSTSLSWKLQIEALRSGMAAEHDLFGGTEPVVDDNGNDDDDDEDTTMRIRVAVRKRPLSSGEHRNGDVDVIHPLDCGTYGRILVYQPKTRVDLTKHIDTTAFGMDNVFDETATNSDIYERSVRNLIPSLLDDGQWASIFAYGQTGSGKTYTMMGNNFAGTNGGNASKADVENLGLYYMAALDIFHAIQKPGYERLSIRVSLFEIYGGKLYDLLNNRASVKCLENSKGNVCFPGLSERNVGNAEELMEKITEGATLRSIGTTSRNADSSRSHAVLQLHLYESIQKQFTALERRKRGTGTSVEPAQKNDSEWSRLTFIDLAGSERGADTSQASRATRLEGAEINTSLLALKEVIRALATGDSLSHVPFRGSKLTQVLKQSFVGKNCRSVMIACISPSMSNCEQTLNTLRYADRVKERNPETGELNPGAAVKNVTPKGKRTNTVRSETSMGTTLSTATTNFSTNQSYSSVSSDILDELLASPSGASDDELVTNESGAVAASKLRSAINVLLATHQDARTFMLEMVKEEMTLVSNADAQVDNFDDYLAMVDTLHEEQLSMITILREQLLQYRLISQSSNTRILPNDIRTTEHSDAEDSFEDLRV